MTNEWLVRQSETVFKTNYFRIRKDDCSITEDHSADFYVLEMPDWVQCLALTPAGELLLVEQYRPALRQVLIEFPAGFVDSGETSEEAIRRELLEETGYQLDGDLLSLGHWHSLTGRTPCGGITYFGTCRSSSEVLPPDPTEQISVFSRKPSEALTMVERGEITSAPAVAALYVLKDRKPELFS